MMIYVIMIQIPESVYQLYYISTLNIYIMETNRCIAAYIES